jgi:AcrR family transcriptional regulator
MSLGRPREFDREAALDAAMRLFWRKGFGDTSLEDLLAVMGISKSSFYAAFRSKEGIFREALQHYSNLMAAELGGKLLQARSGRSFIEEMLALPVQEAREKRADGCLILNSAAEFGQRHAEFCQDVRHALALFDRLFQQAVLRGQNEGDIASQADAASLGTYLSATLGSLRTLAKVGTPPDKIQTVIPNILKALE